MKTFIHLKNAHAKALPAEFAGEDVRYTEELVEYFLQAFTVEGDRVFDPFMGYGTTLLVAERMNRIGYGIEYDPKRFEYVQSILNFPDRAIRGDSKLMNNMTLTDFSFSMTSPPYMGRHHKENPFTAYTAVGEGYQQYLHDIEDIYRQLKTKLRSGARAVVEVSNLKHHDAPITTLAWDIAGAISNVLQFEGETIAVWDNGYGFGYDHSYCLVFSKP